MPMPYSMETGPYLSLFESFFSDDRNRAVWALQQLKKKSYRFTRLFRDVPTAIQGGGPHETSRELADYMDKDWFGLDPANPRSKETTPAHTGAREHLKDWNFTGDWDYWIGSAEDVVRATMIRALSISLGAYADVPVSSGNQHWPIGLSAVCGLRWWEGWVKWRKIDVKDTRSTERDDINIGGYVAVTFLTPSHEHSVQPTLLRKLRPSQRQGYAVNPTKAGDQGLWVTGYMDEKRLVPPARSPRWLPEGEINPLRLGPIYSADLDGNTIVTVSPPEWQGGVLPDRRRTYDPQPDPGKRLPYTPEYVEPEEVGP